MAKSFTIQYLPEIHQTEEHDYSESIDSLEQVTIKEEVETDYSGDEQPFSQNVVEGAKAVWLDAATNLLVSLVDQLLPKVGKTVSLHTKKKMWLTIRQRMLEKGYNFTVSQVESKYRGLERVFIKYRGRPNNNIPYQEQIERILRNQKGYPDLYMDEQNSSQSKRVKLEHDEEQQESIQQYSSCSTTTNTNLKLPESDDEPIKSRSKITQAILKELREARLERKKFHASVLLYFQNKEDRDARKEERAQRKEERDIRKLQLLEKIAQMNQI